MFSTAGGTPGSGGSSSNVFVPSPGSQATSSKAVLAALRTLQDKIRRLESERVEALHEASEIRQQLKNQELEHEQLKQRDNVAAQKNMNEARAAHDRLVEAKTELDIRILRMDERNKEAQLVADELSAKIRVVESEKQKASLRVKELESVRNQQLQQIQQVQQKERDLAQTIAWETKRHEDEMSAINGSLITLQDELTQACHEKNAHDAKLAELDQLVGQLLAVNEALVAQLTGKPTKKASPRSSPNSQPNAAASKRTAATVTVPRVAYTKTVSTQHGERDKYFNESAARRLSGGGKNGNPVRPAPETLAVAAQVKGLKQMHQMYSDIVREIDMDKEDNAANDDDNDDSDDDDDDDSDYVYESPSDEDEDVVQEKAWGVKKRRPAAASSSSSSAKLSEAGKKKLSEAASTGGPFSKDRLHSTRLTLQQQQLTGKNILPEPPKSIAEFVKKTSELSDDVSKLHQRSQATSTWSSRHTPPLPPSAREREWSHTRANPEEDLKGVIEALENEFKSLDMEYNFVINNPGGIESDELLSLISKMHSKGSQLRSLRSP